MHAIILQPSIYLRMYGVCVFHSDSFCVQSDREERGFGNCDVRSLSGEMKNSMGKPYINVTIEESCTERRQMEKVERLKKMQDEHEMRGEFEGWREKERQ